MTNRRGRCGLERLEARVVLSETGFALGASYAVPGGVGGGVDGGNGLAVGDFNGDGKPDVAVINGDQGRGAFSAVYVYLGAGDGSFAAPLGYQVGQDAESILAADVNGDGRLDLLTVNESSADISVLLGRADGTFAARPAGALAVGTDPRAVAVADFDGDGIADVAVAEGGFGDTGGDVILFYGESDGGYVTLGDAIELSGRPGALVAGDFDRNGAVDLVAGVEGPDSLSGQADVLLNDGGGALTKSAGPVLYGTPNGAVATDLDADGLPDVAFASGSGVELIFGVGDGTFTDDSLVTDAGVAAGIAVGDFNGDGKVDVVSGARGGPLAGLSGSTDEFLKMVQVHAGVSTAFGAGDFDGDGAVDFVAASASRGTLEVFASSTTNPMAGMEPAIGGLDPSFGNGTGQVVTTIPRAALTSVDTTMAQQNEVLSAGLDAGGSQVVITRFYMDGTLDTGFGGKAGVRVAVPEGFTARRLEFDRASTDIFLFGTVNASGRPGIARIDGAGFVDESFGTDGILTVPGMAAGDSVNTIVAVKGGFVIGGAATAAGVRSGVIMAVAAGGVVNSKFGGKGAGGTYVIGTGHGPIDAVESIVADARGALYACGLASAASAVDGSAVSSILTLKLSAAGKLDRAFGEKALPIPGYALSAGQKVVLQADGKVVVSADIAVDQAGSSAGRLGAVLVRYTAKGALDATFNGSGFFAVMAPPAAPAEVPTPLRTAGVIGLADASTDGYSDLLSNRTAAALVIPGGKLRQEAATASSENTVVTQSQVVADAVDLAVQAVKLSGRSPYRAGARVTAVVMLSDVGTLPAMSASVPVSVFLSSDAMLDVSSDQAVPAAGGVRAVLKAGTSKGIRVAFVAPSGVSGTVFVFVVIDPDGSAGELTLANNVGHAAGAISITG